MKRHAATFLLTILLLLALSPTTSFAQNSPGGTSPAANDSAAAGPVDRSKVIARLLKEIDAGREYIGALERREAALVEEVKRADEARAALTEAYKTALLEIGELRATIRQQKTALDEREKQVETLRGERDEARAAAKKLKRENTLIKVGLIALVVAKLAL